MAGTIHGAILEHGTVPGLALKASAGILPSQLAQRELQGFPVTVDKWRVWNAIGTNLPATPAADDLGLVGGTWGTDGWSIETGDLKALGATSMYAACMVAVPANYDPGETLQIRARAGMETTIADMTAVIDFEVYRPDGDGTLSADLVSTNEQDINNTSEANFDFTINGATVVGGDILQVRMRVTVNDAATGTAVTGVVYNVSLLCDTRGG